MVSEKTLSNYFDTTGREDILTGGIKLIPIQTPFGEFKVWTKRVGNNPRTKALLLHGGPGGTHEAFVCFDSYFPAEGFEYYYYDQLGSYYSEQSKESGLWEISRFVEEVEQVRKALKLNNSNFYLLGHSWGGMLAVEYALKYQDNIKGLIISNMMMSTSAYGKYLDEFLLPKLKPDVLAEIMDLEIKKDFDNPRYMELLLPNFYAKHLIQIPVEQWPDPINRLFKHINQDIYRLMWGPSELGAHGTLKNWDRTSDLSEIKVPTLIIGATYDTMDPEHMKWVSTQVQHGQFLLCPNGSHCALYDDQKIYFEGLIKFINDVDRGTFTTK
ncbi:MAG: proline iminopeptidase-family hydrolase [Promethearchaeota archaeon]